MVKKAKSQLKKKKKFSSKSLTQTQKIAERLLREIMQDKPKAGASCLALFGDLGSGKTTFTKSLAKKLGIKQNINSPTFVIFRKYPIPIKKGFSHFFHFDCYRLKTAQEAEALGFSEIISNPSNFVVLEWPENIQSLLPSSCRQAFFEYIDPKTRKITIH